MKSMLNAVVPFLLSLPVLAAAAAEEEKAAVPVQTVDMVYVVIFLVIFIGAIAGFLVYFFFQSDDKEKQAK
jgi:hypothetical protein